MRRDRWRKYRNHDKEHDDTEPEHGTAAALQASQNALARSELAQCRNVRG